MCLLGFLTFRGRYILGTASESWLFIVELMKYCIVISICDVDCSSLDNKWFGFWPNYDVMLRIPSTCNKSLVDKWHL